MKEYTFWRLCLQDGIVKNSNSVKIIWFRIAISTRTFGVGVYAGWKLDERLPWSFLLPLGSSHQSCR
jgi:hypothetical protein